MKKIWLILSCALIILASVFELTVPLRIALGLNAALMFADIIRTVRGCYNAREEKN